MQNEFLKDNHQLQRLLDKGISQKHRVITIPPGTYYCANPLFFTGVHNLQLNGDGVNVIMKNSAESGFVFHNCSGIILKGFTIDYDPLPFTQATVVSRNADATEFEFEIHSGYPDFHLTGPCGFGYRASVFDSKTMLWKVFGNGDLYPIERRALSLRSGCIKFAMAVPSLETGDYLAFVNRERDFIASSIEFKHCSTVRLEDLTILASPGMAVYCADMDGENYFRYTVTRGQQNKYGIARLISTNGDGLHYHGGRHGPIIERCDFSFMDDDSININGPSCVVRAIENSNALWIEAYEYNAVCFRSISRGDTIRFMSPENYDIVAEARIESIGEIHETAEIADAKLRSMMSTDYAGGLIKRGGTVRISCDRPLQLSGNEYCNIFNLNCPGFVVRDSYFHNHRAIGLRLFATDGTVENNCIERTKNAAITVGPSFFGIHDGWGKNIVIRGNKITDCSFFRISQFPGAIAISAARMSNNNFEYQYPRCTQNIAIENNVIRNCGASGIFVNAADGVHICGNRNHRSNQRKYPLGTTDLKAEYAIDVQNSSHVVMSDNTMEDSCEFYAETDDRVKIIKTNMRS